VTPISFDFLAMWHYVTPWYTGKIQWIDPLITLHHLSRDS
jgi:hypothetical protein